MKLSIFRFHDCEVGVYTQAICTPLDADISGTMAANSIGPQG